MFSRCYFVAIFLLMCTRKSIERRIGRPKYSLRIAPAMYDRSPWLTSQVLLDNHFDEPGFDLTPKEIEKFKIWPGGVIPYYIDVVSFDKVLRDRLRSFIQHTNGLTGLRFEELMVPPIDDSRWVFFINRRGVLDCLRYTTKDFTNTGVQKVVLGYDCLSNEKSPAGTVLAIAGVPSQHTAPDRDKSITVVTENIIPDKQDLFTRLQDVEWIFHDVQYDSASAGHFHFHEYSANGQATIMPATPISDKPAIKDIGVNKFYTSTDIWKVRMLYNYISKNQQNRAVASQCKKLFLLGNKYSSVKPRKPKSVQPRPKPQRYLGVQKLKGHDDVINDSPNGENKNNDDVSNPIPVYENGYTDNNKPNDEKLKGHDDVINESPNGENKNNDDVDSPFPVCENGYTDDNKPNDENKTTPEYTKLVAQDYGNQDIENDDLNGDNKPNEQYDNDLSEYGNLVKQKATNDPLLTNSDLDTNENITIVIPLLDDLDLDVYEQKNREDSNINLDKYSIVS